MAVGEDVYCTLVMNDQYLPGAAVLAKSLRDAGTQKKLACMVVQENLRPSTIEELQSLYNYVIPVAPIASPNIAALYLMRRPDLKQTFTKIHLWRFTQFRKIVYLDADVVALRAPDELFDIQDDFAAAPDVGFPSIFNTGVVVLRPDSGTYEALRTMAAVGDSFDGADQGLLNQYWEHKPFKMLSFTYNVTPNASYQYEPAYRYYKRDISMVHFIGSEKPWQKSRSVAGSSGAYQELLNRWWAVYDRHFKVSTSDYVSGLREQRSSAVQQQVSSKATHAEPEERGRTRAIPIPIQIPTSMAKVTAPTESRHFPAPQSNWDATRAPPPIQSKPEASSFPTTTYDFSTDTAPYRAPPIKHSDPPKDTHYDFPKHVSRSEEKLTPIFPWEEREAPKPTRVFVDEDPLPPPPSQPEEKDGADDFASAAEELEVRPDPTTPPTPTIAVTQTPWATFDTRSKNAWDDVSGIDTYVRALESHQRTRSSGGGIIPPPTATASGQTHILSPSNQPNADALIREVKKRRESLILTDFPSALERPSLPVTPAPVRRATFWGAERQGAQHQREQGGGEEDDLLPAAEGVPRQEDWDPAAQLEELRRSSLVGVNDLIALQATAGKKALPDREMPHRADSSGGGGGVLHHLTPVSGDGNSVARAGNREVSFADGEGR